MSKYAKLIYSFVGYPDEESAKEAMARAERWFLESHPDHLDWEIVSTIQPTQHGYRIQLEATRNG